MGKSVLVVGADGIVGSLLMRNSGAFGFPLLGAGRRCERIGDDRLFLDLSNPKGFTVPDGLAGAVVAAGVTGFRACEQSPDAEKVNTEGVPFLVERLLAAGVFTIVLSSGAVFDREAVSPAEDAPQTPETAYGRQKSLCEKKCREAAGLLGRDELLCVVRMSKMLDGGHGIAASWLEAWRGRKPARAFSDLRFSPVSSGYVLSALARIMALRKPGPFHLSGEKGLSYLEFCLMLAESLGLPGNLVEARAISETDCYVPFRPLDGSLGMKQTTALTRILPQGAGEVVKAIKEGMVDEAWDNVV